VNQEKASSLVQRERFSRTNSDWKVSDSHYLLPPINIYHSRFRDAWCHSHTSEARGGFSLIAVGCYAGVNEDYPGSGFVCHCEQYHLSRDSAPVLYQLDYVPTRASLPYRKWNLTLRHGYHLGFFRAVAWLDSESALLCKHYYGRVSVFGSCVARSAAIGTMGLKSYSARPETISSCMNSLLGGKIRSRWRPS